ncbi:MAG: transposase [Patescibacteria group bacterium]
MPARNRVKTYLSNGYYHLYNRGVEKRTIFTDHQDFATFLSYLKEYLTPKNERELIEIANNPSSSPKEKSEALKSLRMNNLSESLDLLAYCLMPNHFHILVKQKTERAIEQFVRSLGTRYVQYFNHRHENRVGSLFQDSYKAALVDSEEQLLHLSRYIHRNPYQKGLSLKDCPQPSSYLNYLGKINQGWVKPQEVLGYFAALGINSYESFVEDPKQEEYSITTIQKLAIDL